MPAWTARSGGVDWSLTLETDGLLPGRLVPGTLRMAATHAVEAVHRDVKGDNIHPLYKWLVASADRHDDVEWNFAKFLIGRDGKVVGRFSPRTQPDDQGLLKSIQEALASKTDTTPYRY